MVEQHLAAAERAGVEVRFESPARGLLREGRRGRRRRRRRAGRAEPRSARGAVVLASGGFEADPRMRAMYLGPSWDVAQGARHAVQHRRRADDGARGRRAAVRPLERLPRDRLGRRRAADRRPRAAAPPLEAVLPARDRRQPRGPALRRRGRRLPQLHLREVRRRGAQAARRDRLPALRREDRAAAAPGRVRARRASRATRPPRSASSPRAIGIDPARLDAHRRRVQRGRPAGPVRPGDQGRQAHGRHRRRRRATGRSPLDTPPFLAFAVTCGITFTFGGLRDRRATRACSTAPAARSPACTPPASWSAASSTTTTPAAAASPAAPSSAAAPGLDGRRPTERERAVTDPAWGPTFDAFAAEMIAQSRIPAVALALARDGRVVYERGFGHRDAAGTLPVTPETRFGLGSVTKSFPAWRSCSSRRPAGSRSTTRSRAGCPSSGCRARRRRRPADHDPPLHDPLGRHPARAGAAARPRGQHLRRPRPRAHAPAAARHPDRSSATSSRSRPTTS